MSILQFQDHTYLQYKNLWFVWESCWDSWRPVQSLSWDGRRFLPASDCMKDPLDELYGFGSSQMKQLCDYLTETYSPKNARNVSFLSFGNTRWWRDRSVAVVDCADQSVASWKRMCNGRCRTCRQAPKGKKLTRRQVK
jgi:hypothetical protein